MGRLKGKIAVVTAAGQGIGRATALAYASEGAKVFATDIDAGKLAGITNAAISTRRLDVTDQAAIAAFAGEIGGIDILFNCAGFVHAGTVLEASEEDFDFGFKFNVRSQFRLIKALLPGMLAKGGGSIINMASVAGVPAGLPNRFIYSASKAAVIGMTRSIAIDFVKAGIRCNAIAPGTVQSPSLEERMRAQGDYEKVRSAFVARQPMGRLGTAEEIAELAVYLASDLSAYTTGQVHIIDGGLSL